ncbi:hypothetical protein LUZ63_006819 [Rhynchospora breviuscula]|uniref:X8 domain-containing protein n=1 Tax=Rhynchospora breviuscula TaxID=2022672 RepID=A0A9Q0HTX0_9POAL|nr:hypothetical protein LUZ63_006819 [Rhynchospora breviuscula]
MKVTIFVVTICAIVRASEATWCVCQPNLNDTALQKTIDYACGHGADCAPILQNGACYNPNNVKAHCSYAANSYYQRKGEDSTSCDFGGTAEITSTNPSTNGCTYPASPSEAGSGSTNGTSSQPSGSVYGLGPSAQPENTNLGFQTKTHAALWIVFIFFVLIAS